MRIDTEFDWLLLAVVGVFGLGLAGGAALGIRKSAINSPGDLLDLPRAVMAAHLSVLIGAATRVADWLGNRWHALVGGRRLPPGSRSLEIPSITELLSRFGAVAARLANRVSNDETGDSSEAVSSEHDGYREPPDLGAADFDIAHAWGWLARRTEKRHSASRTPRDIARDAIEQGYHPNAVRELLGAFQDVTYGEFPSTDDRLHSARQAYETLKSTHESTHGGTS